jgi:hypothetical protein
LLVACQLSIQNWNWEIKHYPELLFYHV